MTRRPWDRPPSVHRRRVWLYVIFAALVMLTVATGLSRSGHAENRKVSDGGPWVRDGG